MCDELRKLRDWERVYIFSTRTLGLFVANLQVDNIVILHLHLLQISISGEAIASPRMDH